MIGHADHRRPQHRGVQVELVLDLDAIDVLTAPNNHVLLAVEQPEIAFFVDLGPVARQHEAVTPKHLGGLAGLVPVTCIGLLAAVSHFADRVGLGELAAVLVEDRDVGVGRGEPAAGDLADRVLGRQCKTHRSALGHRPAVDHRDRVESLLELVDVGLGRRVPAEDDLLQTAAIVRVELWVVHHHPQHDRRGHCPADPLLRDQLDRIERRERAHHDALAARQQRRHEIGEDSGVVVERRHAQVDVVSVQPLGHVHDVLRAAQRVDVHRHRALGCTGGARGERDRAQVPLIDGLVHRRLQTRPVQRRESAAALRR